MIENNNIPFNEREVFTLIEKMTFAYSSPTEYESLLHQSLAQQTKPTSPIISEAALGFNLPYNFSFDVEKIRQDFPILQEKVGANPLIWLDNAATTQKPVSVISALTHYYAHENSNIHRGNHPLSIKATEKYEEVRKKVASFIHANSEKEIIFVRGATEGINLVANTFGKKFIQKGDEIIIGMSEHHSNILPWQALCQEKEAILRVIPIHENGELIMEEYAKLLNSKTKLVAITHVSNALGSVAPVNLITQMAHRYGAHVLIDGAQSVPHFEVDVKSIDCDFYIFSAHKLFGPTGIGAVYGKQNLLELLPPWQLGGGMIEKVTLETAVYTAAPYKFEAGTGSIGPVFALGAALDYLSHIGMARIAAYEEELMKYALLRLSAVPKLKIIGNPAHRAGSIPLLMDGIDTNKIGSYLSEYGIALRTGHHCAQPVMAFYGVEAMVRPSLAFYNTREEINILASALEKLPYYLK